jgi:urease accessory protein
VVPLGRRLGSEVRLQGDARFLGWEILCLGRTGSGERLRKREIRLDNRLYRDGKLVWLERGRIAGGSALLELPAGLHGRTVCATLLAAGAPFDLAACRAICVPRSRGATRSSRASGAPDYEPAQIRSGDFEPRGRDPDLTQR